MTARAADTGTVEVPRTAQPEHTAQQERTAGEPGDGEPSTGPRSLLVVAALVGAAAALVGARPLHDNSFLTHLATGRLILAEGVPSQNPFLFTGTDFPVPSWWWSVLLATGEELGGSDAIRILTAAIAGAVGVVLVRLTVTRGQGRSEVALLSVVAPAVLALLCVFQFLSGRPHLAGFLLLAVTVLVWKEERSPWWVALLFAIWVNVHGSWLYGIAVLVAFGVARAVDDRRIRRRDLAAVSAAFAGTVVGGALYPQRFEIMLLPSRQFGDPLEREALSAYREWAPVAIGQPVLWALVGLALLALWGCLRERRWAMAAVVVGLFAMGVSGFRLVPIAAVSLVPFAAVGMRGVGRLRLPARSSARACAVAAVAVALAAVVHAVTGSGYVLDKYPVEAVDWLDARRLVAQPDVRLVSHDYVGNYLEWRFGTDANAYVDDRPDAATLVDYVALLHVEPDWQAAFDRADADVVLWSTERPLTDELLEDPAWVRAHVVGEFTIFCRRDLAERCSA